MNESAIHISSVKREKIGVNKPHDFLVKFNPPLKLDPQFRHFLALDRLSMTYSWYNIRSSYGNNKSNTPMMDRRGKLSPFQMECILTLTLMITFINTWNKRIITQLMPRA